MSRASDWRRCLRSYRWCCWRLDSGLWVHNVLGIFLSKRKARTMNAQERAFWLLWGELAVLSTATLILSRLTWKGRGRIFRMEKDKRPPLTSSLLACSPITTVAMVLALLAFSSDELVRTSSGTLRVIGLLSRSIFYLATFLVGCLHFPVFLLRKPSRFVPPLLRRNE